MPDVTITKYNEMGDGFTITLVYYDYNNMRFEIVHIRSEDV